MLETIKLACGQRHFLYNSAPSFSRAVQNLHFLYCKANVELLLNSDKTKYMLFSKKWTNSTTVRVVYVHTLVSSLKPLDAVYHSTFRLIIGDDT